MPAKRYAVGVTSPDSMNERFSAWGPFDDGVEQGPVSVFVGQGALALSMTPARLRMWREGWERAGPLRAEWLKSDDHGVVLAASSELVDPAEALRSVPRERVLHRGTRRAALVELSDEVRLDRALGRVGLPRRFVDRYLDEEIEFEVRVLRPGLGGLGPGWWREADGLPVAIRFDRVRARGWLVHELAALGYEPDEVADGEAFALARLGVALRDATLARDLASARAVALEIVQPETTPATVSIWIEGPEVVSGRWEADGGAVSPRRARWLLQHVHGLSIAGESVRVRVEPPIRSGRRPPHREPRRARQRRLFSRWDQGVEVDDEGLVGLTPERLALDIAARASSAAGPGATIIDGTCGVGGLAIALARTPGVERVIAVDLDASRLGMARHNAAIYGVAERIEFVVGDVLEVLDARRADALVLDPPWGGRAYDRERVSLGDLPMTVAAALARFDGPVLLKLPRSFEPTTLPDAARWKVDLLLDEREIPKMLLAQRTSKKS